MAWTPTVAREARTTGGVKTETITLGGNAENAAASEWEIDNLPTAVTITYFKAELVSGTGTTINPSIGNATGWTTTQIEHIATQATTGAFINDQTPLVANTGSGSLFVVSGVDAAADNAVEVVIVLRYEG